jgi:hypothetical protein
MQTSLYPSIDLVDLTFPYFDGALSDAYDDPWIGFGI